MVSAIKTGQDMRAARVAMGLSQATLALLMGATPQSISRMERGGRSPTLQHQASLALIQRLYELGELPGMIESLQN